MSDELLFTQDRKVSVLRFIEKQQKTTVNELCELFHVSGATIRSDLRDLEALHLVIRTHGGAIIKPKSRQEVQISERAVQYLDAKKRIARAAIEMIEDGDTIVLDNGTTPMELAKLLYLKKDVTVLTNDLPIASYLENVESVRVIVIGGELRKNFHCTLTNGFTQDSLYLKITADKAFIGLNGFSLEKGASTPDTAHAETKQVLMAMASKVILLFDSSKLGKNSFIAFAPIDKIDAIVIDALDDKQKQVLEENGVQVILAEASPGVVIQYAPILPARGVGNTNRLAWELNTDLQGVDVDPPILRWMDRDGAEAPDG